jgi:hypothetical protein
LNNLVEVVMESVGGVSSSVVILSWGSLLAYPKFFLENTELWQGTITQNGYWKKGGPTLPIEFSRKCDDGSLMSVVDHVNGTPHETHYVSFYETTSSQNIPLDDIKKRLRKLCLIASGDRISTEEEKFLCCDSDHCLTTADNAKDSLKISHAHDQGIIGRIYIYNITTTVHLITCCKTLHPLTE